MVAARRRTVPQNRRKTNYEKNVRRGLPGKGLSRSSACSEKHVATHRKTLQDKSLALSNEREHQALSHQNNRKEYSVFIRNLPFTVTAEDLKQLIAQVLPPRRVTVINDKEGRSRGFGFAVFLKAEDAAAVVHKFDGLTLEGRVIQVELGVDRASMAERKASIVAKRLERGTTVLVDKAQLSLEKCICVFLSPALERLEPLRAAALMSQLLPSSFVLSKVFCVPNTPVGSSWIFQFSTVREAASVAAHWPTLTIPYDNLKVFLNDNERWDGPAPPKLVTMQIVCGTVPRDNVAPPLTDLSGSLIVRNLNFQTTKEDLFSLCKPFGLIRSLRLVKRKTELSENSNKDAEPSQHRHSGCAFVTYKRLENAKKAMEALNGHVFKGRPITVDWGVDKKAYEELKEGLIDLPKPDFNRLGFSANVGVKRKQKYDDTSEESSSDTDDTAALSTADSEQFTEETSRARRQAELVLGRQSASSLSADDSSVGISDEQKPGEPQTLESVIEQSKNTDIPELEDTDEEGSAEDAEGALAQTSQRVLRSSDADEGRTVHIRSVAFDATEADLYEALQRFGSIVYVRIVKDANGKPKGTAFVKFKNKDSVRLIMDEEKKVSEQLGIMDVERNTKKRQRVHFSDIPLDGLGLVIKGRRVRFSVAVSKTQAAQLEEQKKQKEGLKKNAHLADIGFIGSDSWELNGMSKSDLQRRLAARKEYQAKLSNPNYVVNPLRLSIRNLPPQVTKEQLHSILTDFIVTDKECHRHLKTASRNTDLSKKKQLRHAAMRAIQHLTLCTDGTRRETTSLLDRTSQSSNAVSPVAETNSRVLRSRGFAFAAFHSHDLALRVLQHLNNNPDVFGTVRRPIVAFALEDKRALRHHQIVAEHNAARLTTPKSKLKRKTYSRGRRQRERKRQRRIEQDQSTTLET